MKIFLKNSEVTLAQLKAELRVAEEALQEQALHLEEKPKIPSKIMVYEKQCRWFNLPFPFNDHFNLHGHIIIETQLLKLCVNVSPILVSMGLLLESDLPQIAELTLARLKDRISDEKARVFNAKKTLTESFS